jgi:putative tryptophan/tyrosine transport system substrate-binding protein
MTCHTSGLLVILALGLLMPPFTSGAQSPAKLPRIGVLWQGDIPRYEQAFRQGLQEQGYIEGRTILVEYRVVGWHSTRASELAAELVHLDVDLIFASTGPIAQAAQQAAQRVNRMIPIVFGPTIDPVGTGLVTGLARPGGNMTGLGLLDPEFRAKHLEILKEAFPHVSRVAWLASPPSFPGGWAWRALSVIEHAAQALGIELVRLEVQGPDALESVFNLVRAMEAEAIMVALNPLFTAERRQIVDLVAKSRVPAIYGDALFIEDGGLMAYGPSMADLYRRAAALVAKVLRGTNSADIPVEQPMHLKLIINLKTAQALGLTLPPSFLFRADEVIK